MGAWHGKRQLHCQKDSAGNERNLVLERSAHNVWLLAMGLTKSANKLAMSGECSVLTYVNLRGVCRTSDAATSTQSTNARSIRMGFKCTSSRGLHRGEWTDQVALMEAPRRLSAAYEAGPVCLLLSQHCRQLSNSKVPQYSASIAA